MAVPGEVQDEASHHGGMCTHVGHTRVLNYSVMGVEGPTQGTPNISSAETAWGLRSHHTALADSHVAPKLEMQSISQLLLSGKSPHHWGLRWSLLCFLGF